MIGEREASAVGRFWRAGAVLGLAALLAACGDSGPQEGAQASGAEPGPEAQAAAPAGPARPGQVLLGAPGRPGEGVLTIPEGGPRAAGAGAGGDPNLPLVIKVTDLGQSYWAVVVNPQKIADPQDLVQVAMDICEERSLCQVAMWTDARRAPAALPVSSAQMN